MNAIDNVAAKLSPQQIGQAIELVAARLLGKKAHRAGLALSVLERHPEAIAEIEDEDRAIAALDLEFQNLNEALPFAIARLLAERQCEIGMIVTRLEDELPFADARLEHKVAPIKAAAIIETAALRELREYEQHVNFLRAALHEFTGNPKYGRPRDCFRELRDLWAARRRANERIFDSVRLEHHPLPVTPTRSAIDRVRELQRIIQNEQGA